MTFVVNTLFGYFGFPESTTTSYMCSRHDEFPNVSVLLKIACSLPVFSCDCERSASVLRRLHIMDEGNHGPKQTWLSGTDTHTPQLQCGLS